MTSGGGLPDQPRQGKTRRPSPSPMNAKDRKQQTEPASTEEMSQSITCRILLQLLWSANCKSVQASDAEPGRTSPGAVSSCKPDQRFLVAACRSSRHITSPMARHANDSILEDTKEQVTVTADRPIEPHRGRTGLVPRDGDRPPPPPPPAPSPATSLLRRQKQPAESMRTAKRVYGRAREGGEKETPTSDVQGKKSLFSELPILRSTLRSTYENSGGGDDEDDNDDGERGSLAGLPG
ncbi:hypothetical protein CPLU01_07520 [Colletotrichum plurivorum]|uniref:Uncharacterized protein n=1 Tax=Colletotrichum plurivorum TaxID=2175906 RepID=A0A8H6NEY2_9PEZI|nr:hypothetical protein CPLU01_07520 [Colletotrichum plurivorum]